MELQHKQVFSIRKKTTESFFLFENFTLTTRSDSFFYLFNLEKYLIHAPLDWLLGPKTRKRGISVSSHPSELAPYKFALYFLSSPRIGIPQIRVKSRNYGTHLFKSYRL